MTIGWDAIGAGSAVASVLAALGALFYQVLGLKRSIQSSTYQEIVRMFDEFSRLLIERPELGRMIFGQENIDEVSEDCRSRIDWAIAIRFDWFESIVIQKKRYKALPDEIYVHWLGVLKEELTRPTIKRYWEKSGRYYHPDLQKEIGAILQAAAAASPKADTAGARAKRGPA